MGDKCELHEIIMDTFRKEVEELKVRMKDMEMKHDVLAQGNIKIETTIKAFEDKFNSIEGTLKEIISELKTIGNKLAVYSTVQAGKMKSPDGTVLKEAISGNNKILLIVVTTVCVGLLILLGVGADDIIKAVVK